jgi:hypothetical protein
MFRPIQPTPRVTRQVAERMGLKSVLWVPMIREGAAIGVIGVVRATVGLFSDEHATDRGPRRRRMTRLDAFDTEHLQRGDLDAGVDWQIVWMACDCGASMARRVDEDDRVSAG